VGAALIKACLERLTLATDKHIANGSRSPLHRAAFAAGGGRRRRTAFLSALAVEGRASPSAHKQRSTPWVFLLEHELNRKLGEMNFTRATLGPCPQVLSTG